MYASTRRIYTIDRTDRQHDGESRAAAFAFTHRAHSPAVHFNQMTHDREAESHAAMLATRFLTRLSEPIEDVRQKIRRDALAGVANNDLQMRINTLGTNLHPPAS